MSGFNFLFIELKIKKETKNFYWLGDLILLKIIIKQKNIT